MAIGPVGGGPAGSSFTQGVTPVRVGATPNSAAQPGAGPAALLGDAAGLSGFSGADLARLAAILESGRSGANPALTSELLQTAILAAAEGDLQRALEAVTHLSAADPLRAETLRAEPGLQPIRPQIESLLARLTNVAQIEAETRVAEAARAVDTGAAKALPGWDMDAGALLAIANRLLEAGGHENFVRAAQAAQVVIDAAHWAPAAAATMAPAEAGSEARRIERTAPRVPVQKSRAGWAAVRQRARERTAILWRRAPLLVLLLAWLGIGTAAGLASLVQRKIWPDAWPDWLVDAGFSVWGLGFLALVLFGFYMRVRNVRL